jgi:hypothetical protein
VVVDDHITAWRRRNWNPHQGAPLHPRTLLPGRRTRHRVGWDQHRRSSIYP